MTSISLEIPTVGEKNTVAEPKVGNSIKKVEEFINSNKIDGATNIKESSIKESNLETSLQEAINKAFAGLELVKQKGSVEGENGKFYEWEETATLTLPTPTKSRTLGVFADTGVVCTVSAVSKGGKIYGDFVEGPTSITLEQFQHVTLQADGSNWFIQSGEPKRTQTWTGLESRGLETEYPTTNFKRPHQIQLMIQSKVAFALGLYVGGVQCNTLIKATGESALNISFQLNPGQKWKLKEISGTAELCQESNLPL